MFCHLRFWFNNKIFLDTIGESVINKTIFRLGDYLNEVYQLPYFLKSHILRKMLRELN